MRARVHVRRAGLLFCAVASTLACSREESREPARTPAPAPAPEAPRGYEVVEVEEGGTISGRVVWEGEPPAPVMLPVALHAEACGEERPSPALVLGPRGGVAHVVVWLEGVPRGRALETETRTLAMRDCELHPHVLALAVGSELEVRSEDPFLHNAHAWREGGRGETWFSLGLPHAGASHRVAVTGPGVARVLDDAGHGWMLGWVHAFEHPYFAVTDAQGRFRIEGIPPGRYTLRAWHEGFLVTGSESGRPTYSRPIVLSRSVTVTSGHDTPVDFALGERTARAAGD